MRILLFLSLSMLAAGADVSSYFCENKQLPNATTVNSYLTVKVNQPSLFTRFFGRKQITSITYEVTSGNVHRNLDPGTKDIFSLAHSRPSGIKSFTIKNTQYPVVCK